MVLNGLFPEDSWTALLGIEALQARGCRVTVTTLSKEVGMSPKYVSACVSRFVERGLVVRENVGNTHPLTLTRKGERVALTVRDFRLLDEALS